MTARAPVAFWFTKQYAAFGFQPQGRQAATTAHVLSHLPFFAFTQPYVIFRGLGQSGGTTPPPPGGIEYTLSGGGLSELFITTGTLGAAGLSYPLNPMSKRTN